MNTYKERLKKKLDDAHNSAGGFHFDNAILGAHEDVYKNILKKKLSER